MKLLILLFSAGALLADTVSPLSLRGYSVIPQPQKVEIGGMDLRLPTEWSLAAPRGIRADDVAIETLESDLKNRYGLVRKAGAPFSIRLVVASNSVAPGKSTDGDKAAIAEQAYRLEISRGAVTITANAAPGLFYGVATFIQLVKPQDGGYYVPEGVITDWPDLHLRHIYWDDAHHLDRLAELKRAVRQAAFFKINGFSLKLEGHFQFRSAPALVEPYAMSPAEYQELTDYGLRYHVQVVPYIDGPAHIAFILKHPEYAKYRSFPDSNYELCAVNPDAVRLLSGMFQDLINANRGGKFVYLSTDEPYYIGLADNPQCREKGAAQQKGSVGKLLADFIAQVANPLHSQGRTVIFWGEYPLKTGDIESLPSHLVNGEVYGPQFDPLFKKHGIRQMIYTSTQGGISRFFPDYFALPNSRRLHPVASQVDRIGDGFRKISYDPARTYADVMGAVVAGWADMGLHPETFWLGYATITAAAWHPGTPSPQEAASSFYRLFYGHQVTRMDRVYQLMSQQSQIWLDSWESGPSSRKPLFGNSNTIYNPRRPVRDQTLALPPAPGSDLRFDSKWIADNARRLELASAALDENDELIGLLNENLARASFNRYNLEVYLAVARLYRQNLEMLLDIGRICSMLEAAQKSVEGKSARQSVSSLDKAIELAQQIRQQRNTAFRDAVATYYKSWYPRVGEANGRKFLHDLDDVKDHVPDRTVDMTYLIDRELQLPFGRWIEDIRAVRNAHAQANNLPANARNFDWKDLGDHPVVGGIPEE